MISPASEANEQIFRPAKLLLPVLAADGPQHAGCQRDFLAGFLLLQQAVDHLQILDDVGYLIGQPGNQIEFGFGIGHARVFGADEQAAKKFFLGSEWKIVAEIFLPKLSGDLPMLFIAGLAKMVYDAVYFVEPIRQFRKINGWRPH